MSIRTALKISIYETLRNTEFYKVTTTILQNGIKVTIVQCEIRWGLGGEEVIVYVIIESDDYVSGINTSREREWFYSVPFAMAPVVR